MYRRLLGVFVTGPKSRPGFWCRAPPCTQTPPAPASGLLLLLLPDSSCLHPDSSCRCFRRGLPAQPIVYNSVLAACEAAQQLEAGMDVLDEMRVRCACCAGCAVLQLLAQHPGRPALHGFLHDSTTPWRWLFLPPSLFHSCPPSHPPLFSPSSLLSPAPQLVPGVGRAPRQLHLLHPHVHLPSQR